MDSGLSSLYEEAATAMILFLHLSALQGSLPCSRQANIGG